MLKSKSGKRINSTRDLQNHSNLKGMFDGGNEGVKIGFPNDNAETQSTEKGDVTALFKAMVNNFGLGVPKRPFMSVAFHQNSKKYANFIRKSLGKLDNRTIVEQIGNLGKSDVIKTIVDFKSPPNAEATIKAKGDNNPLIDSSHMVNSVTYAVKQ